MSKAVSFDKLPHHPVRDVLPDIVTALDQNPNLVLIAPPGAGKTTLVPLALIDSSWRDGRKIIVLEPRRLAARAAAARMASLLGEPVGKRVGYRVRFDSKVSSDTFIEVITEGVFRRILAEDPGLEEIAAVLLDEFHERSLDGDLALALCLDLQQGLREDLRLIAMSATIDGARVAELMGAKTIESEGSSWPVELTYRDRRPDQLIEDAVATAVRETLADPEAGSVLVFLPGQREIERCYERLTGKLPGQVKLHRLYGALAFQEQDDALKPAPVGNRKVVLASAIAETSLTIEGVTTVIDSGLSRQPVYEPATGLVRLQTVRSSQASVTQRAGRAGRLGPGKAIRLWREAQTASLPAYTPPEITNADLSSLLLDLADWGVNDPNQLAWLDTPPASGVKEAKDLLMKLGALSPDGMITVHGRAIRAIALPPRLAHMVLKGAAYGKASAKRAALLALLMQERGVGGNAPDIGERAERALAAKDNRSKTIVKAAQRMIAGLSSQAGGNQEDEPLTAGVLLGYGFPDRIAQRRGQSQNGSVRYLLANGTGSEIDAVNSLSREEYLVVVDMVGRAGASRILSASGLTKPDIIHHFDNEIDVYEETKLDLKTGAFQKMRSTRLGKIILDKPVAVPIDPADREQALLNAIREHGLDLLPWSPSDIQLRNRLAVLHSIIGDEWVDVGQAALLDRLEDWLQPLLGNTKSLTALPKGTLSNGLMMLAGYPDKNTLDRLVPSHFKAPSGSVVPLIYTVDDEAVRVVLSVRPQELFGLSAHPLILDGKVAVDIELLSPAGRPIQITRDLPGFWIGSWKDVRSEMRGRYPKHPWPEDPANAEPTTRVKPRK